MSALKQLRTVFQGRNIIFPLILGVAVAVWMFTRGFNPSDLKEFVWSRTVVIGLIMAIVMMLFRDLGYIIRLRILSEKALSWKQCFQLTFLWEFTSAISPGIVGGTAAAFVLLAQENINTGKSTSIVLATSFLDVLFYVLMVPLLVVLSGFNYEMPEVNFGAGILQKDLLYTYFIAAYIILFIWALVVFFGLFIRPQAIKAVMIQMFRLPFLKKWRSEAENWGNDLVSTAHEFGRKGYDFWLKAMGATIFSWVARFAAVNFIIFAFGHSSDQLEIFARQLIMWCILILPITPGASVLAESVFPAFLGMFFQNFNLAKVGALLWRLIGYYPYLFIGFVVFPIWLKRIIKVKIQHPEQEVES